MVTMSSIVSKTAMIVGRRNIPDGRPTTSGFSSGNRSIRADHVVAHEANQPGGHRRQIVRQFDGGLVEDPAQGVERTALARRERVRVANRIAIDRRIVVLAFPKEIRLQTDKRVSAADRAAFHRFQKEAIGAVPGQLEHSRYGRFEVRHQPAPNDLRFARLVAAGKRWEIRTRLHPGRSSTAPLPD